MKHPAVGGLLCDPIPHNIQIQTSLSYKSLSSILGRLRVSIEGDLSGSLSRRIVVLLSQSTQVTEYTAQVYSHIPVMKHCMFFRSGSTWP